MQDPEAPAKNYQVLELKDSVTRIESKLDTTLKNQVTKAEMDLLKLAFEEKLLSQRREIDLTYGPLVNSVRWFTRSIIVAMLFMLGNVVATVLLIVSKGH
jgi:hypothetical protein